MQDKVRLAPPPPMQDKVRLAPPPMPDKARLAPPPEVENPFKDISTNDWFYDAVMYVYRNGLMVGMSDIEFGANVELSRGMMMQILYNHAGKPDASGVRNPFKDISKNMWYTDAVKWASGGRITNGYGDGTFGANDPVTNEQLAKFIHNMQAAKDRKPPDITTGRQFIDRGEISAWAEDAVGTLLNQGILQDIQGNYFNPQKPATRAIVASMLYRYLMSIGQS